ncbi:MAG: hypothetical protein MR717_06660, partial [Prevotella sp.]|nr:hypothetical protein [Prevotella sp.]
MGKLNLSFFIDFVDSLAALGIAQASLALLSFAKEFFIDFVDSLAALGIAQASLALLSFAKEFFTLHFLLSDVSHASFVSVAASCLLELSGEGRRLRGGHV